MMVMGLPFAVIIGSLLLPLTQLSAPTPFLLGCFRLALQRSFDAGILLFLPFAHSDLLGFVLPVFSLFKRAK
jgi:hypothetical protein